MATIRSRKDFLGFILEAQKDTNLTSKFLSQCKKGLTDLYNFFQEEGFTAIPRDDCRNILDFVNHPNPPIVSPGPDWVKCY
jgi:hypothetical protein